MASGEAKKSDVKHGVTTMAIHAHNPDDWNWKPMALPLVTSSNFKYGDIDKVPEFMYGRYDNPTRQCLEKQIKALEGAKYAMTYATGMAAFTACMQLLKPGDGIVCSKIVYGGVLQYMEDDAEGRGLEVSYADAVEDPHNVRKALKENTRMVWLEVCTNPYLRIIDVGKVCKLVAEYSPLITVVVDNTFMSPCGVKPLELGVHVVMHSMTKYMNGHGDVIMGCLSTNRDDLHKTLYSCQKWLGLGAAPFDSYLVSRSLKTLAIRMRQHEANATAVAKFLESHPAVKKVMYPGLPSHPEHELAVRILSCFGGMVAVELNSESKAKSFVKALKIFSYAVSLGSTESLVCLPWTTSHGMLPADEKRARGISENLVRLSIGLEDEEDIIEDLKQALDQLGSDPAN